MQIKENLLAQEPKHREAMEELSDRLCVRDAGRPILKNLFLH